MYIISGSRLSNEDILKLAKLLAMVLRNRFLRFIIRKDHGYSEEDLLISAHQASELAQELEASQQPNQPHVVINFTKYLDTLGFLITIEAARMILGDKRRREWLLDAMDLDDETADDVYNRLSRLMAEVRSTERQFPSPESNPELGSGQ